MPKITGTVTTKNILTAMDAIEISLLISIPIKSAELNIINGTIKIANKLTTAVKLTDNATSPLANLVKTLEVTPPGAAAITITPIAISIGIGIIKISPKAIMGNKITCDKNPTIKSLGVFITLVKSFVVKPSPKPNIIIAKQSGAIFVAISIYISLKD
tara:strand:+ start:94 stop:567 length:474 start_codon:yes stop_codon:yes gene_type:complete